MKNINRGKRPKRGGVLTNEGKQKLWDQKLAEFKKTTDAIGLEIEDGIIDTVVVLNLLGFRTQQSCEGHTEHGMPAPWVMIAAPNQPSRWVGEAKIRREIATKHGLKTLTVPLGEEPSKAHLEAWEEETIVLADTPETPEFKKWRQQNHKLQIKARQMLEEFYQKHQPPATIKLVIEEGADYFAIHNGGQDYEKSKFDQLNESDKKSLGKRLESYRTEIRRFTEFLKHKYFNQ